MPRAKGQGTGLTPEIQEKIVAALKDGAFFNQAAIYAGVSPRTAEDWLYNGRKPDAAEDFRAFVKAVDNASVTYEIEAVRELKAIAAKSGDWRPILEVLKRRAPERWGDTQRIEMAMEKVARDEIARAVLSAVEDVINHHPGLAAEARRAILSAVVDRLDPPSGQGTSS